MPSPHSASASAMLFSAPVRLSRPSFGSVYRPQHPLSRPSSRSSTCPRASISRRSFRSVSSHRLPTLFPLALSRHSSPRSTSLSRLPSSRRSYPPLLLSSPASSGKIIPRKTEKNDKNEKRIRPDRRVTLIRHFLYHPATPRPLRLSRLRTMRHWTIHRAAQLHYHTQRQAQEMALERQYNAIRAAMEELRVGVAAQDGGRLYNQAIQRHGLMGGFKVGLSNEGPWRNVANGGVPLEYARAQVDRPSRDGWDHGWVRM